MSFESVFNSLNIIIAINHVIIRKKTYLSIGTHQCIVSVKPYSFFCKI